VSKPLVYISLQQAAIVSGDYRHCQPAQTSVKSLQKIRRIRQIFARRRILYMPKKIRRPLLAASYSLPKSHSDTFKPRSMSVTSTRLLVTFDGAHQLMQFDAVGDELRRVQLSEDMSPAHAVESPTGTFIISHFRQPHQGQVMQ